MKTQPQASASSRGSKIPASAWICALLVLGIVAVYWPVFYYGFIDYDDPDYVFENPQVIGGVRWSGVVWAFTTYHASNWHPLTWLSLMLDTQLFGFHAGVYHTVNVLLHAANAALLFLLLKRLTGAFWRCAFVAALFGIHPLHVESVAWISERKDVLSTFFFMLTLIAYTHYVERSRVRRPGSNIFYGLALLLFALGLMSKPMLVTLPFVLLLLDYWPLKRVTSDRWPLISLLLEKLPFFALSAVTCVITVFAEKRGQALVPVSNIPFDGRLQNTAVSYLQYLGKMIWPSPLVAFYPYPVPEGGTTATAVIILVMIFVAVFYFLRRRPYLAVGWLWYLGMLVPMIGLVQVGIQGMADRYTYLPLIGLFFAITWLAAEIKTEWPYWRPALSLIATGVLVACGTLTAAQVHYWQNSEVLARHALAVTTNNAPMEVLLGNALLEQKKYEEASGHFAEAARIFPTSFPIASDLGFALASNGRVDDAIVAYRIAAKLKPEEVTPHYMLGHLLSQRGNLAEAMAEYQTALHMDPNHALTLNDFAWLLATASDAGFRNGTQAVELAEKGCQLTNYKLPLFVGTLAAAYAEADRFDDAAKTANRAIALATAQKKETLAAKNRELIKLYQAHQAYHEPPAHHP